MKTFKDNAGRTWTVQLDVWTVKRVKAVLSVDMYALLENKFEGLTKLLADPVQLCDVLFVICQEEATKQNLTDEDFGRAMRGDAIVSAAECLFAEFADFFHDPLVRDGLKKLAEARGKLNREVYQRTKSKLDQIDMDALITHELDKALANEPSDSLASVRAS